jgi:hypothetical protein
VIALFQDPDIPRQAGDEFGNQEQVHPLALAAFGVLAVLALLLPRRWSAFPIAILLCFIPAGQRVLLFTVDFSFIRLLILISWLRVLVRRELRPLVWNHLDRMMVVWAFTAIVTGTLQLGTLTGFINRLGTAVDSMAIYFFFRMLIRNRDDLLRLGEQFALLSVVVLGFFLVENRTQRNMFAMFGGVPEITDIRDGRLRCQGAFAHPILAGCFWASLVPIYLVRGWLGRGWRIPVLATGAALGIVVLCNSSTPIMAVLFGILGGLCFLVRGALRWFRWLILGWLLVLHFVIMKTPVWHLLARIDVAGGSTGWHRTHLLDKFFEHFKEWCLVGVRYTGDWGYGLQDVTNQYVGEGVLGGLPRLCCFLVILFLCFSGVSRSMRMPGLSKGTQAAVWALGTSLFMHCMNFIAVSYFEQASVLWDITLAAVGSLTLVPGARPADQLRAAAESLRSDSGAALAA